MKFREISVTKKLLIAFAIVIVMFFTVAIYSNIVIRDMDYLYRYRIYNMEARNVLLLEFHQELTEFRRLLKASYYNPVWIETAGDTTRRIYEDYITQSHARMERLAYLYITSVSGDSLVYERLECHSCEDLVAEMEYIMAFVDEVYRIFHANFFIGGNDSHDKGNVLDYTRNVENTISNLRDIEGRAGESVQAEIEQTIALNQTITIITLLFALVVSLAIVWITVKSFKKWAKNIEESAVKSNQEFSIAEANSQAKSRFLARMSHEIRTPVAAVIGVSEIQLQKNDLPKDVEDAFSRIYTSSGVLIGILNDILDLSKIEAGKMDIIMAEYDVASFIQEILQLHVVSLDNKKFKFVVHVDKSLPVALIGDALRLKQVLTNIMSNAFKYTELGIVEFSIKRAPHSANNMINMEVIIRDTGRGMTQEQVETLLKEEYTRFHDREHPEVYGTGLGMPIVLSLIELMGASIGVESHIRAGTKVTIQIPQQVASLDEIGATTAENLSKLETVSRKTEFKPKSLPHGKVLVVDDVETNLFVAKGLLGLYDLQIETCTNAMDAISKVKCGETFDIIFMDYMMPSLNGMEAAKILRGVGYKLPLVALTANALVGQAEEFLSNGFDDFIAKPIQTRNLHHIVMNYVGKTEADSARVLGGVSVEPVKTTKFFASELPEPDSDINSYYNSPEVINMVRDEFKNTQKDTVLEIKAALAENDNITARRLSHTIKGMAHMMKEEKLSKTAQAIESTIYKGGEPTEEQILALENEMEKVLAKE
ncbi:MAG: response regulator [Defluviitaleaceae bacterium]|nr:response regulator [Defluviitaleaceae bacterium]